MRLLATLLLATLGLARGAGGVLLLTGASGLEPGVVRNAGLVAASLLLVSALSLLAATGVWQRRAWGVPLGIVACGVFVLGGLVNGYLLFGAARLAGILVNLAVATVIVVVLWSHARHPDGGRNAEAP
jgi:hypothetical protein